VGNWRKHLLDGVTAGRAIPASVAERMPDESLPQPLYFGDSGKPEIARVVIPKAATTL